MYSEPEVSVLGGPDLFINAGSFINLTCCGTNLPGVPEDVFWFHEEKVGRHEDHNRMSYCHLSEPRTISITLQSPCYIKYISVLILGGFLWNKNKKNNSMKAAKLLFSLDQIIDIF